MIHYRYMKKKKEIPAQGYNQSRGVSTLLALFHVYVLKKYTLVKKLLHVRRWSVTVAVDVCKTGTTKSSLWTGESVESGSRAVTINFRLLIGRYPSPPPRVVFSKGQLSLTEKRCGKEPIKRARGFWTLQISIRNRVNSTLVIFDNFKVHGDIRT